MSKFKKKHLILTYKNYKNDFKDIKQGQFALYFNKSGLLKIDAYKALIFFLKKKLKFFSKLFIRVIPTIYNTKKSIGIRMGKGKGSLNQYYMNISRGQIFLEFGFKKKVLSIKGQNFLRFIRYLKRIIFLASLKTKIKFQLFENKIKWYL